MRIFYGIVTKFRNFFALSLYMHIFDKSCYNNLKLSSWVLRMLLIRLALYVLFIIHVYIHVIQARCVLDELFLLIFTDAV